MILAYNPASNSDCLLNKDLEKDSRHSSVVFVWAFHPAATGSNPKHTINDLFNLYGRNRKKYFKMNWENKRKGVSKILAHFKNKGLDLWNICSWWKPPRYKKQKSTLVGWKVWVLKFEGKSAYSHFYVDLLSKVNFSQFCCPSSVVRFDEISPKWRNHVSLWQYF